MPSTVNHLRTFLVLSLLVAWPAITVRADEKTEPPVPVRTVAPVVPNGFFRNNESGLVTVSFTVDEKGNVEEEKIVKSTHQELEAPALAAIKKWRFKPARKDGVAVSTHVSIPIKFTAE